jgi:KRAB domain-containing zinc finger protein
MDESYEISPLDKIVSVASKQTMHTCDECPYESMYKHNLTKHRVNVHEKQPNSIPTVKKIVYMCDQCTKSFSTKYGLTLHVHSKHDHVFKYKCTVCTKGYNVKANYKGHLASHDAVLVEICRKCGAKFRYQRSLEEHMKSQHEHVSYKCVKDGCTINFTQPQALREHDLAVHSGRQFSCPRCGQVYKWRSSFTYHTGHCTF